MSRKYQILTIAVLFTLLLVAPAGAKDLIPAGTILYCTLDEPNFSAKTATVGDPVLCQLGPLRSFGHSVLTHGAQLSGHLQDYKNPGHLAGKGWLAIEFDRIILPNADVLPLSAKIISAPHLKVDAVGEIHGKGHPKRDALEWAIPVLWPIKIMTLPARGPYPTLKGETRLAMRLMEDVELGPSTSARNSVPAPPWVKPGSYHDSSAGFEPASAKQVPHLVPRVTFAQAGAAAPPPVTVIALQAGAAVLARDYWVDGSNVHCIAQDGAEQDVPLAMVDLTQTVKVNQERNVEFALHAKGVVEQ
jgi:hypothetical protein